MKRQRSALDTNPVRLWRVLALLATAILLWIVSLPGRHGDAAPASAAAADHGVAPRASRSGHCNARTGLATLDRHVAQLERARDPTVRCEILRKLGLDRAAGDSIVALVASYTRLPYDEEVRGCAVSALGTMPRPAALEILLELPKHAYFDPGAVVRSELAGRITGALAIREEPAARAALRALARDPESPLQVCAAIALADAGEPLSVDLLTGLLRQVNPWAQGMIFDALSKSKEPGVLAALQALLDDPAWAFADAAIHAMSSLGTAESTRSLLQVPRRRPELAAKVLHALHVSADPAARRALLAAAKGEVSNRLESLPALRELKEDDDEDARAVMLHALTRADPKLRRLATEYFHEHGDERAVPELVKLTKDKSAGIEQTALESLGRIGGEAAFKALEDIARTAGRLQSAALGRLSSHPDGGARGRAVARDLIARGGSQLEVGIDQLSEDPAPEALETLLDVARSSSPYAEYARILLAKREEPAAQAFIREHALSTPD